MKTIKNRFICPIPEWLRGELLEYNRLYAYPVIPEDIGISEFQILDSGGYSLMKQKRRMSYKYIENLAIHYSEYDHEKRYLAAPDVGGNMWETMKNFEYYITQYSNNVQPVLHYTSPYWDFSELKYQLDFYKERINDKKFIFSGKGRANVELMKKYGAKHKINLIQKILKNHWLHIFGIGWGVHDCRELAKFGKSFSIDTINYYQAAEVLSRNANEWDNYETDRVKAAIINASKANNLL